MTTPEQQNASPIEPPKKTRFSRRRWMDEERARHSENARKAARCDELEAFLNETGQVKRFMMWWARRQGISEESLARLGLACDLIPPPPHQESGGKGGGRE